VNYKKVGLRLFFVGEIIFFVVLYFVSSDGVSALCRKREENRHLALKVESLKKEIEKLEADIQKWEHNPFYREKVAREQLQMARPTDEVYYVS